MAEYIEREALLAELAKGTIITDDGYGMGIMAGMDFAMKKVAEVPAAYVTPVVHAKWIHKGQRVHLGVNWWGCSVCGDESGAQWMRYCPNCGARMDGE